MREREREIDPYWTADEAIGELRHGREQYLLRLRLHENRERFSSDPHELFPLGERSGERVYYHAKLYITPPDVELAVGLSPSPRTDGSIGEVLGGGWVGVRVQDVGQAQAWYYPRERALVLWECFLEDRYRSGDDPQGDPGHVALWDGFERTLLRRQPETRRIYTTWEDLYGRPAWRRFLEGRGYEQLAPAAFAREVGAR